MAECVAKQRKTTRVCIGSMNQRIVIKTRQLTPNSDNDVDYDETFTSLKTVWSMVETVSGKTIFDQSNEERDVTHNFYIRYIAGVTFQEWIQYKDQYFDVLNVENFGEQDSFQKLTVAIRGSDVKPVNFS